MGALHAGAQAEQLERRASLASIHRLEIPFAMLDGMHGSGLANVRALILVALACDGNSDQKDCVPGDSSQPNVVCTSRGEWVSPQETAAPQGRDDATCPALPHGLYVLHKDLASGFACPALADEVLTVLSDGTLITQQNTAVETACIDETTIDGCSVTITRLCALADCRLQGSIALDSARWVGLGAFSVSCSDGAFASCTYDLWLESR